MLHLTGYTIALSIYRRPLNDRGIVFRLCVVASFSAHDLIEVCGAQTVVGSLIQFEYTLIVCTELKDHDGECCGAWIMLANLYCVMSSFILQDK